VGAFLGAGGIPMAIMTPLDFFGGCPWPSSRRARSSPLVSDIGRVRDVFVTRIIFRITVLLPPPD
jgi:hypothetical protein